MQKVEMKEGEGCELVVREERKLRREALLLPDQAKAGLWDQIARC